MLANPSDGRILKVRDLQAQRRLSQGSGYDAGHVFGDQFGGPGDVPNLVLMKGSLNRAGGSWYKMETSLAELTKNNKVRMVAKLHYRGNSDVPHKITVDAYATATDGSLTKRRWTHNQ
jgi:hypothetical protein